MKRFMHRGKMVLSARLAATIAAVVVMTCAPTRASVTATADYLIHWQYTATTVPGHPEYAGGWGWRENYTAPGGATTGATMQGMLRAYDLTGNTAYLNSAKAAGTYIINGQKHPAVTGHPEYNPARFGTYDPYVMWELSQRAGDNTWSNHAATNFFDTLTAGTYGENNDLDTAGYIAYVQGKRLLTGSSGNLRSWEFSTLAYAAQQIGNTGQDGLFQTAILDGLNTLDSTKGSDFLGVAGAVRGLALMGTTTFDAIVSPLHAGINGIDTLVELADYLVTQQDTAGHWWYGSANQTPDSDEDTQTTAYAILGLMAMDDENYADSIATGRSFLASMQLDSGGYWSYPGQISSWNIEVAGEALAASVPEPATIIVWSLLGLTGAGLGLWRRKRVA